jgi:hypothetical protein
MQVWRAVVWTGGNLISVTVQADNRFLAESQLAAQYGLNNIKSLMENY